MNRFTQHCELQQARSSANCLKFTVANLPTLTWDCVLTCLNENVKYNRPLKVSQRFGIVIHDTTMNSAICDLIKEIGFLDSDLKSSAHLYVSLTDTAETFGWHKDTSDVIFWQAIGKTLFSVRQGYRIIDHILEPNDLLYIPRGIMHNTRPLTPRAGVSFGLDYLT